MSRQRMVKPEFYDSENLGMCSVRARFLFIALWVHGNDYGNLKARLGWIRLKTFPYDSISEADILEMLCELERVGCVRGYVVDGEAYINIPNFATYQTVRKPGKSNVPDPPGEMPRKTHVFTDWHRCGTVGAPVPDGCATDGGKPADNPVEKQGGTAPVQHQYDTNDARKKEGKKEVVVLQQQLPKEAGSPQGAVENPTCPMCGTEVTQTGMKDPDFWWCDNCQESLAEGKAVFGGAVA